MAEQMFGAVTAVSGKACWVQVREAPDVPASIPLSITDVQPRDEVVLSQLGQSWFVSAVLSRPAPVEPVPESPPPAA